MEFCRPVTFVLAIAFGRGSRRDGQDLFGHLCGIIHALRCTLPPHLLKCSIAHVLLQICHPFFVRLREPPSQRRSSLTRA